MAATNNPISRFLLLAIATAPACDLGKGDDDTGANGSAETGVLDDDGATSFGSTGLGEDSDGGGGTTNATSPITATSTSGPVDCDAAEVTTDPTVGPTGGWGSSWGDDGGWDTGEGGSPTSGATGTSGTYPGDTDGGSCDVPLSPGGNVYGCECEDPTCEIWFEDVAPIPGFGNYCDCLCTAAGCGEAVGGVGEAGGESGDLPP